MSDVENSNDVRLTKENNDEINNNEQIGNVEIEQKEEELANQIDMPEQKEEEIDNKGREEIEEIGHKEQEEVKEIKNEDEIDNVQQNDENAEVRVEPEITNEDIVNETNIIEKLDSVPLKKVTINDIYNKYDEMTNEDICVRIKQKK